MDRLGHTQIQTTQKYLHALPDPDEEAPGVVAGIVLISVDLLLGDGWYMLAAVGLLALTAGALDFHLLGPLLRLPLAGPALCRAVEARTAN